MWLRLCTLAVYVWFCWNDDTQHLFNGHFPEQPCKQVPECLHSGFYWAKNDGGDDDNCSYKMCKSPFRSSPPSN